MKKLLVFLLILPIFLCSCSVSPDIKDRMLVEAMGIDFQNGRYELFLLSYNSHNPDEETDTPTVTVSVSAKSVSSAIALLPSVCGKLPFYANNRIIVIGKNALDRLPEITDFLIRDNLMRTDAYMVATDRVEDVLTNEKSENSLENNLVFTLLKNSSKQGTTSALTVLQVASALENNLFGVYMPYLQKDGKNLVFSGVVAFENPENRFFVEPQDCFFLSFTKNFVDTPVVESSLDGTRFSVDIISQKTKMKLKKSDGKFTLFADVFVKFDLSEVQGENFVTPDKNALEIAVSHTLKERFKDSFSAFYGKNCDALSVMKRLRHDFPDDYRKYQNNTNEFLENLQFDLHVSSQNVRTGQTS